VVAKRLVELMGGVIGVESEVGVGSVFWFELMAVAEPHVSMQESEPAAFVQVQMRREARPHTLLYVEDDPANMKLVERIIARHADIHLLTAVNGNSGIEIARASRPDVILMDINLPDLSGLEVLQILRLDSDTARIPVIAISANAMPIDIDRGLKAGFSAIRPSPSMSMSSWKQWMWRWSTRRVGSTRSCGLNGRGWADKRLPCGADAPGSN
jgi:CheY-like chemotaxis protein